MNAGQLVLGIDGGGTKTLAWLAIAENHADCDILGRGRAGPSNPCSVGFSAATAALDAATAAAFRDASRRRAPVAVACLAVAGTDRPDESRRLEKWAFEQQLARIVHLSNDAEPILACTRQNWGVALIAGTGSFALARSPRGEIEKVGGWGFRFGDEGSGYAVATGGLTAAVRFADGRGPQTRLLHDFLQHFEVTEPRNLISQLYRHDVDRRQIADLAPVVLSAAESDDRMAVKIVERAASELGLMVHVLQTKLEFPATVPLALTGGLLVQSGYLRDLLQKDLQQREVAVDLVVVAEPVLGAVELARRIHRESVAD